MIALLITFNFLISLLPLYQPIEIEVYLGKLGIKLETH